MGVMWPPTYSYLAIFVVTPPREPWGGPGRLSRRIPTSSPTRCVALAWRGTQSGTSGDSRRWDDSGEMELRMVWFLTVRQSWFFMVFQWDSRLAEYSISHVYISLLTHCVFFLYGERWVHWNPTQQIGRNIHPTCARPLPCEVSEVVSSPRGGPHLANFIQLQNDGEYWGPFGVETWPETWRAFGVYPVISLFGANKESARIQQVRQFGLRPGKCSQN